MYHVKFCLKRKLKYKKKKIFWMGLIKNSQTSLKSVIRNHKSLFAFSPVLGDPGINLIHLALCQSLFNLNQVFSIKIFTYVQ